MGFLSKFNIYFLLFCFLLTTKHCFFIIFWYLTNQQSDKPMCVFVFCFTCTCLCLSRFVQFLSSRPETGPVAHLHYLCWPVSAVRTVAENRLQMSFVMFVMDHLCGTVDKIHHDTCPLPPPRRCSHPIPWFNFFTSLFRCSVSLSSFSLYTDLIFFLP